MQSASYLASRMCMRGVREIHHVLIERLWDVLVGRVVVDVLSVSKSG